jgi:hypothetical protein
VVLCLSFGLSLSLFVALHSCIISRNQTTIEAGLQDTSHNLGSIRDNWEAVFGRNPTMWFLPLPANDTFVANRLGTFFKRSVASVARAGEVGRWAERQRDWQASHPRGLLVGWCFRGVGKARPSDWLFWWSASAHIGGTGPPRVASRAALHGSALGRGGASDSELVSLHQHQHQQPHEDDAVALDGVFGGLAPVTLIAPGPGSTGRGTRHDGGGGGAASQLPSGHAPRAAATAAGVRDGNSGIAAGARRQTLLKPRQSRASGAASGASSGRDATPGHAYRPTATRGPYRPTGHDILPAKSALSSPSRPSQGTKKTRSVRLIV